MKSQQPIPVTVVMRSYNDAKLLPRTLAALDRQQGVLIELIVIESASTDNSLEILEKYGPDQLICLKPGEYHSSRVLNKGISLATTELVALINSDAILESDECLLDMAKAIRGDMKCAGVFARQSVRADANAMTKLDYEIAFAGDRSQLGTGASWMSLVVSMIRWSAWDELPFDNRVTYAEDAVWSHHIQELGWHIRYVGGASAEHSHNYSWHQRYKRAYGDAEALAAIRGQPPARTSIGGFWKPYIKRVAKDSLRCVKMGMPHQAWKVPFHRWPQLWGAWHGQTDGWKRMCRSKDQLKAPKYIATV